jgi:tetratricopeptide (TPR) repeat protein
MGDYAAAEPLLKQALEIARNTLWQNHPDVASYQNDLAEPYRAMGKLAEAESLYRQALEIIRRTLGDDHPDFALTWKIWRCCMTG